MREAQAGAGERTAVDELLEAGGLEIHFQPIVDLRDGLVVGAEALARLPAAPGHRDWFALAAAAGATPQLEIALVELAIAQSRRLPRGAYLSVNVSPDVMCMPRFRRLVRGVRDRPVLVEITEHGSASDVAGLKLAREELGRAGVRVAIDDAGAGYSGLQRIADLEPDVIKLDASLAQGIDCAPVRQALVAALVDAAGRLGADVVVEGVERPEQLEALRTLDVRYGQGYLLGRPGPLPIPAWMPLVVHRAAVGERFPFAAPRPKGSRRRVRRVERAAPGVPDPLVRPASA